MLGFDAFRLGCLIGRCSDLFLRFVFVEIGGDQSFFKVCIIESGFSMMRLVDALSSALEVYLRESVFEPFTVLLTTSNLSESKQGHCR